MVVSLVHRYTVDHRCRQFIGVQYTMEQMVHWCIAVNDVTDGFDLVINKKIIKNRQQKNLVDHIGKGKSVTFRSLLDFWGDAQKWKICDKLYSLPESCFFFFFS